MIRLRLAWILWIWSTMIFLCFSSRFVDSLPKTQRFLYIKPLLMFYLCETKKNNCIAAIERAIESLGINYIGIFNSIWHWFRFLRRAARRKKFPLFLRLLSRHSSWKEIDALEKTARTHSTKEKNVRCCCEWSNFLVWATEKKHNWHTKEANVGFCTS